MTGLTVGTATGNKDATEIHVGAASGNKAITEGWVGTASGNKQFYSSTPPLSVDASPDSQSWIVSDGPDVAKPFGVPDYQIYSATITATPTGGLAPYTYAWSQLSGADVGFYDTTDSAPTLNSTDGGTCTFRCAVTDSLGTTVNSDTITVHN